MPERAPEGVKLENTEIATPIAPEGVQAGDQPNTVDAPADVAEKPEGEQPKDKPEGEKPEGETPEQREKRLSRRLEKVIGQRGQYRAEIEMLKQELDTLRRSGIGRINQDADGDSEALSISRSEFDKRVREEAAKLAPDIAKERDQVAAREAVIDSLSDKFGKERFDALARNMDDAFGGLRNADGSPKAAVEAIFEVDDPGALVEYLGSEENEDEAERIAKMTGPKAVFAIAKLALRLAEKGKDKPQPSKAAAPIEPVRGGGGAIHGSAPTDMKQYMAWAHKQYGR